MAFPSVSIVDFEQVQVSWVSNSETEFWSNQLEKTLTEGQSIY